jgi:SpoVK/Ycf46/Vps4 family AAA+-type ATPase
MRERIYIQDNPPQSSSSGGESLWKQIAVICVQGAVAGVLFYYGTKWIANTLKMEGGDASVESKQSLAKRLKRDDVLTMTFNSYEARLLNDVLGSEEITVTFEDIGGLAEQVDDIHDNIVLPLQLWNMSKDAVEKNEIIPCPTGVLLYGAPGTGKTLIAKAIAKESGATFLNIKASSINDKYFGESDKLASALFSLARKLGPTVIFIDEIETLLRKRGSSDFGGAVPSVQGVFLTEWDGLVVERNQENNNNNNNNSHIVTTRTPPVVVLGATNRPNDIDAAFLRRMPLRVQTLVPDYRGRLEILKAQLKKENLKDSDVDLEEIAEETEGFTGSDLKELIRIAHLQRVKEFKDDLKAMTKQKNTDNNSSNKRAPLIPRNWQQSDFMFALKKTQKTGE